VECLEDRLVPSTFTVTTKLDVVDASDGKLSLREAITKANANPGADVIVVPAGVYKIALSGAGEDANATGDFDITDAVTIQGAGAGLSIIDGQQLERVFDVKGSTPSSIKAMFAGLTVRGGNAIGDGGGIRVGNSDLVIRDSVVSGNRASLSGGGISNGAQPGTGNVKVVRTTVARNVANEGGGGLSVNGVITLTITDSTVRRNISGGGGGISASTANLTNSTVSGNSAKVDGGGVVAVKATLTNCTISGNSAKGIGGGIVTNTAATLTNSLVSGNIAGGSGGGLFAFTPVTLKNCTVSGNSAGGSGNGGGIFAPTATLTNSTVSGNSAPSGGGGLFVGTQAILTHCTVSGNSSNVGGGIDASVPNLTNCTVSGNSAIASGGGINAGVATLTNCTVSSNRAGNSAGVNATTADLSNCTVSGNSSTGGAGGIHATTANLTNCTVSGNSAATDGGGIFATTATLLNDTIAENSAHTGGGLFQNPGGTFTVRNTIVALNLVDFTGIDPDIFGAFTSQGHNLIGDRTGGTGFTNDVNGDIVGTSASPIDPKLDPLQNNGGKTQTMALKAGSPAIDAGDNSILPQTDQRGAGFARLRDGNFDGIAIVDIGAFEK